jgi:hypothetical protein|tara:strand:+ start:98 stop:502 length:405 start_codon:yes stop_codon:yes gene_type:complete
MFTDIEFQEAMAKWPAIKTLEELRDSTEFRIYYDALGNIIICCENNHENTLREAGIDPAEYKYLVVSSYEYGDKWKYRVVNNKLKLIDINTGYSVQLKKGNSLCYSYKTVKSHAGILIENEDYKDIDYYDITDT